MKVYIGRYPKDSSKEQKISVRIDKWDTWSMDHTLAHIVTPMLKQLRDTKHGAPYTDDADVPEELRKSAAPPTEHEWDTDDNHFKRWDWILDEMIFAFESKLTEYPEDEGQMTKPVRWKVEGDCDWEARDVYQARITNGFRLFGKYYESLWD
jgi:hypothetical protein